MTREQAIKRSLELYPEVTGSAADLEQIDAQNIAQRIARKAYLKGYNDATMKDESEDWKMVMECAQTIVNIVKEK